MNLKSMINPFINTSANRHKASHVPKPADWPEPSTDTQPRSTTMQTATISKGELIAALDELDARQARRGQDRQSERRLDKVRINIPSLPWDRWNDIYSDVIDPLANEGTEIHYRDRHPQGDGAIRENTVELGIKESLSQRGIRRTF